MARPKGTLSHTETKNRVVYLRVSAREYALTKQIAYYTEHSVSQIIRKSLEDFLTENKELLGIINCSASYLLSIPLKMNNNNKRRSWFKPKTPSDKLHYKKPLETEPSLPLPNPSVDFQEAQNKQDAYLSFLEESLTAAINDKINQTFKTQPLKEQPDSTVGMKPTVQNRGDGEV